MLRWLTAGESHGPALVAILEGLPAGVAVTTADIDRDLARRRLGVGRGARMKFEQDEVRIVGGVRHGSTLGGPGRDRGRQQRVAEVGQGHVAGPGRPGRARGRRAQRAADPAAARARRPRRACRSTASTTPVRSSSARAPARPRPGSRSAPSPRPSSRRPSGPAVLSHVVELGTVVAPAGLVPVARRPRRDRRRPGPLPRPRHERGDGGRGRGRPQGRRHPRRRRRGRRARPPAGPRQPRALGPSPRRAPRRRAHGHPGDQGRRGRRRLRARPHPRVAGAGRDRAGGARARAGLRPQRRHRGRHVHRRGPARPRGDEADLDDPAALRTVDVATGEPAQAINQRSDVCAVPAAGVVAEAMVALVLADAVLEKFGGDSVGETARNVAAYRAALVVS